MHPAKIGVGTVLIAEQAGVCVSAVHYGVGHAIGAGHALFTGMAVGKQPGEVGGVDVFGKRSVGTAIGVDFVGKHIADA